MTANVVETLPFSSINSFFDADTLIFFNSGGNTSNNIWKTDGTETGTQQIFPPPDSENPPDISFTLTDFNSASSQDPAGGSGKLLVSANENEFGTEPWISDGTTEGTKILKDINPVGSSSPSNLFHLDGTFFFTADDGVNGEALWKSDGTEAGTSLVADIDSTGLSDFTNFNGTLFFVGNRRNNREIDLWKSDGTEAGTQPITSFDPVTVIEDLTVVEDTLFFERGRTELWKSDGTTQGTEIVAEELSASQLTGVGNTLFFTNDDGVTGTELWKSDGTSEGTQIVKDIRPEEPENGVPVNRGSNPRNLIDVNGTLFFTADLDSASFNGEGLWKSDGTTDGTVLIREFDSSLENFTQVNGTLYFTTDLASDSELWQSDGTAEGTFQIEPDEISVGGDSFVDSFRLGASESDLTEFNDELLFTGEAYSLETGDYEAALLTLADIEDGNTSALSLTGGTAQIAYVAYYGRPGDSSGLEFWNGVLTDNDVSYTPREGDTLTGSEADVYNRIVDAFGNAAEADRIFGDLGNRGAVNQVYQYAFNRDGDSEGLDFWTDQIEQGNVTLATFALEVALGAQGEDVTVLNNKIESADLFTNSIDTPAEIEAYQGSDAEIFGRNWLANYGSTVSTQAEVNEALTNLVG